MNDPVDELFAVSPDEFVRRRNELAKQLEKDGETSDASRVRALRKPTLPIWALNQVSRGHPEQVEKLLRAHRELRGAGSAGALRDASGLRHQAVAELVESAAGILEEEGRSAGPSTREKMTRTLLALATEEASEEQFQAGRLEGMLEPSGLEALSEHGGSAEGPSLRAERLQREAHQLAAKAESLWSRVREAEERARRAEQQLGEARRAAEEAQEQARAKQREADQAVRG